MELAPDVWEIEGYCGTAGFLLEPPSGNIFILRDGDMVLLMDTGHHPYYRKRILEVLTKLRQEGARDLVLVLSHGHWDHGKNNDVIYEAGYETTRFFLPEPEFATLNILNHMLTDMDKVREFYDPLQNSAAGLKLYVGWARNFPEFGDEKYQAAWQAIESQPEEYDGEAARRAFGRLFADVLCPDLSSYIADKAEPLALADREKLVLGDVELTGWRIGRFFLWHDASQSPGHVCIYDPKNKLMITGDATLEINPPFFDCDFNACIETCEKGLRLAETGYVEIAADSHRTSQWWPRALTAWNCGILSPVQTWDYAQGQAKSMVFYQFWLDYFVALRDEIFKAHYRIGEADIHEIVQELRKSTNKNVLFKFSLFLPNIPSSPETQVLKVMLENGAARRVEEGRVLFKPIERWNF